MTSTPRPFDLAALDIAGTTLDEGGLVYEVLDATVADTVGQPLPKDLLARWKGTSKREAITGLLAELDADASEPAVDKVFAEFTGRLTEGYRTTPPTPFPGVTDTLADLRTTGVRVALQTGYDSEITGSILAGLGWEVGPAGVVDAVITSDLVPASRPAPYLIFRCMEATGVTDVRRVLVAGDTPNDLGAGTNAGAGFVVGVLTGSFGREALGRQPHTHLLDGVAGLSSLL
jgi:phosphonatase-like hydrolase